ncbi:MAG: Polar amino acid ABC transporter, inner membrane subunit [Methanomicrobiales archaeon 53_19]|jgi:polar amino acid transport system permease protein|uniref:amino acid ABC transporter permease n=1 Tax=Methanocalculus sp. TaxID=2004547 RepID=UPI000746F7F3|nr:amino acid ABC transporter permease [Methanocalculus sp.]KUK71324.1 MAG: Polar amino acid ABC transporter, inner membrane subunit [Methanocalculus sp. 52_23]KUL04897.1 MAG: Polar amino acid ABC transporter, inner membrane subunit [Methanomicrobiales archaeon 53_19]HIJ06144.1 amino acid ABC transporter permease [Methanocalculus sp.]
MIDLQFDFEILLPALYKGALVTFALILVSAPFGFLNGIGIALGRTYGNRLVSRLCQGYVLFFKGCPLLLLLFIIYFGLPSLGITFTAFTSAVIGFILCNGAYNSEYIRGGIQSVSSGQMTAALSLGMSRVQAIRSIILPQALRKSLPGLSNEFIYLIKYSSLAYMITVIEITGAGNIFAAKYFAFFEVFILIGIFYLGLVTVAGRIIAVIEKKIAIPGFGGV